MGPPFGLSHRPAYSRGDITYLLHDRSLARLPDDKKDRFVLVFGPLDGPPLLVLRTDLSAPTTCFFGDSVGMYGYGALGIVAPGDTTFILSMPWKAPVPAAIPLDLTSLGPPTPKGIQRQATSTNDLFLEAYTPDGVGVFNFATGAVSPRKAPAEYVVGVVDGAVGVNFSTRAMAFIRPDSTYFDLVVPEAAKTVTWVSADHANGDALVWMESAMDMSTGLYASPTLWTSPYATSPFAIKRRKVAIVTDTTGAGGSGMIANAGMALTQANEKTATLTRLSDGQGWTIAADPGQVVVGVIWVDAVEVIVGVKPETRPGPAISIQRLRRDVLGAPDIASGL